MDSPIVSVIVATYNYGNLIDKAIVSVQRQSFPDWECLIIDDGSIDDTPEVVKRFATVDSRIKYHKQTNGGPSAARNRGMDMSRGRYIQFLDADDLLENEKLASHVEYLDDHPEVDIVYGEARYFSSLSRQEQFLPFADLEDRWLPQLSGGGHELLHALLRSNFIVISAPLFRRDVIEKVGLFDSGLCALEDWDFWLRCGLANCRFDFHRSGNSLSLIRDQPSSRNKHKRNVEIAYALMIVKVLRRALAGEPGWPELSIISKFIPEPLELIGDDCYYLGEKGLAMSLYRLALAAGAHSRSLRWKLALLYLGGGGNDVRTVVSRLKRWWRSLF